jgi:hypothetical protein
VARRDSRHIEEGKVKMKVELTYLGPVEMTPARVGYLKRYLRDTLRDTPNLAEGVITLDGIEHYYTYAVEHGVMSVNMAPRDFAEAMLNENNLSTHEPWSPLPGRHDERWGRPPLKI